MGRRGFAQIGNIVVPVSYSGNGHNNQSKKELKEQRKIEGREFWSRRAAEYKIQRTEIIPIIQELIMKSIEQNGNLEPYLNQLLEVLSVVSQPLECNKYICVSVHKSRVVKKECIKDEVFAKYNEEDYSNDVCLSFLARDGRWDFQDVHLPLFKVEVIVNEYGDVVSLMIQCANVIDGKKYSFKNNGALYLNITGVNDDVTLITHYTKVKAGICLMVSGSHPVTYEVSNVKENVNKNL